LRYFILLFLLCSFSNAHKVNLFISEENSILDIYSYFSSGKPCMNCQLIIKDKDKIILDNKLNSEGKYLYSPKIKNLEVIVEADGGHRASEKIQVENIKHEDLEEHIKDEQSKEYINIIIGLALIVLIFLILKLVKRK